MCLHSKQLQFIVSARHFASNCWLLLNGLKCIQVCLTRWAKWHFALWVTRSHIRGLTHHRGSRTGGNQSLWDGRKDAFCFFQVWIWNREKDRMTVVVFVHFYSNCLFLIWIVFFFCFFKGLVTPAPGKCKMITACTRNKNDKDRHVMVQRRRPKCSSPQANKINSLHNFGPRERGT